MTQDLYLATPFSHPLANRDEIDLIEAKDYPFILYNEKSGLRPIIDELFNKIDVQPHIAYELAKDETICGFVAAKLGIAIVPNIFGIKHFPIKLIKIKQPTYEWKIYLSYKHTKYMAPPVCKFKDFILEHYPPLADKHEGE